jgi:hypothetical protein
VSFEFRRQGRRLVRGYFCLCLLQAAYEREVTFSRALNSLRVRKELFTALTPFLKAQL